MEKNDGGPAFPMEFDQITPQVGMTLRDYFAAAALQGIVSSLGNSSRTFCSADVEAIEAYKFADAMLEARK